jgi:isopenicillin N synthase-like dioxygenase
LSEIASADLTSLYKAQNFKFRLCDYTSATAAPENTNGCGAHTDYGTLAIIFQDGKAGLEAQNQTGGWTSMPGDATIVLCG